MIFSCAQTVCQQMSKLDPPEELDDPDNEIKLQFILNDIVEHSEFDTDYPEVYILHHYDHVTINSLPLAVLSIL